MTISNAAARAREAARARGGEFGEQQRSAPELTLGGGGLDLSTHTPVDIDNKLSELYDQRATIMGPLSWRERDASDKRALVEKTEAGGERYEGQLAYLNRQAEEAEEEIAKILEAADAVSLEARPYEQEFTARGGWTRVYLTTGSDPHLHNGMQCSTCNRDGKLTRFAWMTDYSGVDEQTIVEAAASRACTTCWPSAPVDLLSRPTSMFTPDEKRKKEERLERERAKVERDAKRIASGLTADGSEFVVRTEPGGVQSWRNSESFKTERSAVIWATDHLGWAKARDHSPERQEVQAAAIRTIAEAIAIKHDQPVEYVLGELQVKADVKQDKYGQAEGKRRIAELRKAHGIDG